MTLKYNISQILNVAVKWVALLLCTEDSDLGREFSYFNEGLLWFFRIPPGKS
jgi:hypothetical protein